MNNSKLQAYMTVAAYIIRQLGKEKKKYTLKGIVNAVSFNLFGVKNSRDC